jgi:hypothetical protein
MTFTTRANSSRLDLNQSPVVTYFGAEYNEAAWHKPQTSCCFSRVFRSLFEIHFQNITFAKTTSDPLVCCFPPANMQRDIGVQSRTWLNPSWIQAVMAATSNVTAKSVAAVGWRHNVECIAETGRVYVTRACLCDSVTNWGKKRKLTGSTPQPLWKVTVLWPSAARSSSK